MTRSVVQVHISPPEIYHTPPGTFLCYNIIMKPEEIPARLQNIIEDTAEKRAEKRASYALRGALVLATVIAAASPAKAEPKISEPDKVINIDIPDIIAAISSPS